MPTPPFPTDAQLHRTMEQIISNVTEGKMSLSYFMSILSHHFGGIDMSPKESMIRDFLIEDECEGGYTLDDLEDDLDADPSTLRFAVGNTVMCRTHEGWFLGKVVACCQTVRCSAGKCHRRIPYVVEYTSLSDEDPPCLVRFDSDEYIKPRMSHVTPDPSSYKPQLAVPDDPLHYLYTNMKRFDSKTEDGTNVADLLKKMKITDNAETNPDGSISFKCKGNGQHMSAHSVDMRQDHVFGVDFPNIMMYVMNHISHRFQFGTLDQRGNSLDYVGTFKSVAPEETDLDELEWKARSSPWKMLQLADGLMLGIHGWEKNSYRACKLYRAAAWGCAEEEETNISGSLPVGIPQAMIQVANICILELKQRLGFDNSPRSRVILPEEWIKEGLRTKDGMKLLDSIFHWIYSALVLHEWVTTLTIMVGKAIREMKLVDEIHLLHMTGISEMEEVLLIRDKMQIIVLALECREKQVAFEKMQHKGKVPRGCPPANVIAQFEPKAFEIFNDLPMVHENMHIEFRQVPRSPFPIVAVAFFPTKKKLQNVVCLPDYLQMTPFSKESFEYVWLRTAYDLHLGGLGTGERVRPLKITVPNNHGNDAFAAFLEDILQESDTEVKIVSHNDTVKNGKRKATIGQAVSDVMAKLVDIPGLFNEYFSDVDVVSRVQEDYIDRIITGQSNGHELHSNEATKMKAEGNRYFMSQDYIAAVKCYSMALGHTRRLTQHNTSVYNLIGTTLCNRAACFLSLSENESFSIEFRKMYARNAINDCLNALDSSWASSSLPETILEKLRFRRDKATARFDYLNQEPNVLPNTPSTVNFNVIEQNNSPAASGASDRTDHQQVSRIPTQPVQKLSVRKDNDSNDALIEHGVTVFKNNLAKNAEDGCPICLREFNGELSKTYVIVLPCGEHAVCANCTCTLKIEADKAKECPQCPLCRYSFNPSFVEEVPSLIIEIDQNISNLILKLPHMEINEKVAIAERLLWTNRFDVPAVIDAIETLLDGEVSGLFFRSEGELTHEEKSVIYNQARAPVKRLEEKLALLLADHHRTFNGKKLDKLCDNIRKARNELTVARQNARDEIYNKLNSVGGMGAEQGGHGGSLIKVDYHGMHANEMRIKFKDHVLPILPVVSKVMIITGRGAHSVGNESKLKKALFKLVSQYEDKIYWQQVENNPGALFVLWRSVTD